MKMGSLFIKMQKGHFVILAKLFVEEFRLMIGPFFDLARCFPPEKFRRCSHNIFIHQNIVLLSLDLQFIIIGHQRFVQAASFLPIKIQRIEDNLIFS